MHNSQTPRFYLSSSEFFVDDKIIVGKRGNREMHRCVYIFGESLDIWFMVVIYFQRWFLGRGRGMNIIEFGDFI